MIYNDPTLGQADWRPSTGMLNMAHISPFIQIKLTQKTEIHLTLGNPNPFKINNQNLARPPARSLYYITLTPTLEIRIEFENKFGLKIYIWI